MAAILEIENQKFIDGKKTVADGILLSCKKRLAKNKDLTNMQLLNAIKEEFIDVYVEDMRIWSWYLKKNRKKIDAEVDAEQKILKLEQENLFFQQENADTLTNHETTPPTQESPRERKDFHSGVSHLPGDIHIEESQPTGDRNTDYEPMELNIIIPPRISNVDKEEIAPKHPELNLNTNPISKKELDEKIDKRFPFGKMR